MTNIPPAAAPPLSRFYCRRCDYPLAGLESRRCPECGLTFDPSRLGTLSIRPNRRRRRMLRKVIALAVVGGLLGGYAVLAARVPCGFAYSSYCTECGATEDVDERHLPLFGLTYRTWRSPPHATRLSSTLAQRGVRVGHSHHWVVGEGGDYGLRHSCALGNGRYLRNVVSDPAVATFVDGLCRYADPATRDRWLGLVLDPFQGQIVVFAMHQIAPLPPGGFPDAASFEKWWRQNGADIELVVEP